MSRSEQLFAEAREIIPGGVNSPVRAFAAVGGKPPFIARAKGSRLWDVDGRQYIDYVCSWGPLILGHAPDAVVARIAEAAAAGTSYGATTERELLMARAIRERFPSMEMVRLVSSGTEATMSAVRLARGATGRERIIKLAGCYHGHADSFLIEAGSGVMTLGIPGSPGVTAGTARDTLVGRFNDLASVAKLVESNRGGVAALILEPVMGNAGVVPPAPGFLEGLREITKTEGIVLIFDEVITGFRVAAGGAQALYGVKPDLTCLGKIIGGGLPVGAFGGRRDLMEQLAPAGPVYQAGTLSGNPLALAAGLATLDALAAPGVYERLERTAADLEAGLRAAAHAARRSFGVNRVGSMMSLFFTEQPVTDYASAKTSDTRLFAAWFAAMLERGIYLAPSQFEAAFVSLAHTAEDIARTAEAAAASLKAALSR
jgi:glutamate-1-semialdehyde 2,1-aminomutase